MKVALCAPTGRAAKRMSETTGREARTIHRMLEIGKIQEESKLEEVDVDLAPIDADVIIIDEMSMVDVFLMNYVCKGIYLGTKLVLVGDSNQLPSVGPRKCIKRHNRIRSNTSCSIKQNIQASCKKQNSSKCT